MSLSVPTILHSHLSNFLSVLIYRIFLDLSLSPLMCDDIMIDLSLQPHLYIFVWVFVPSPVELSPPQ